MVKKLFFLVVLSGSVWGSNIIVFSPQSSPVTNRVTAYLISQDTSRFLDRTNVLINPTLPNGVAIPDLKVSGGQVVEMSQAEKDAIAAAEAALEAQALAAQSAAAKTNALAEFDAESLQTVEARRLEAFATLVFIEINKLRQQAGLAQYTANQFRTAMRNQLAAQADE